MKDISPISGGYLVHAAAEGTPVTTSLIVANETGNEHASVVWDAAHDQVENGSAA